MYSEEQVKELLKKQRELCAQSVLFKPMEPEIILDAIKNAPEPKLAAPQALEGWKERFTAFRLSKEGVLYFEDLIPWIEENIIAAQQAPVKECYVPVSVDDELPKEGIHVFALVKTSYGKTINELAMYTEGGKIEFDDEDDNFPECFDEQKQVSFFPKGWWAQDPDEEKAYPRNNVTHWLKKVTLPVTEGLKEDGPSGRNNDKASVASHSCTDGNSIEQYETTANVLIRKAAVSREGKHVTFNEQDLMGWFKNGDHLKTYTDYDTI